jgi:hypothetical protein
MRKLKTRKLKKTTSNPRPRTLCQKCRRVALYRTIGSDLVYCDKHKASAIADARRPATLNAYVQRYAHIS